MGKTSRQWFADNLRILLVSLVVVHHVAAMFSGLPAWFIDYEPSDAVSALVLNAILLVNQAWFMGAFFLLSGYFTPGSLERKGRRAFLRDRAIRLGVPLLGFSFVLNPILDHGRIGTGPLWFAFALLVLDVLYAFLPRPAWTPGPPRYRWILAFVIGLAVVTYVVRIGIPVGFWIPVVGFPSGAYLPQYASFFALGVLGVFPSGRRMGWVGSGMAAGAFLTLFPLALFLPGSNGGWVGHGTPASLLYALWDSTFAVGMALALLTLFKAKFNVQGPVRRYLSTHSFTVYVFHAFAVSAAGFAVHSLPIPTLAKFALAAALALSASFLAAGPIRRVPGLRKVL